jgi:hypothetical protein
LLVADLMRLHGEPAPVGLFGICLDGDDVLERLVVADLIPGVVVQRIALNTGGGWVTRRAAPDGPDLFDREQISATGLDDKVPYVAVDACITRAYRLQPE